MTVADILNRAADLIEPEGAWMQGGLRAFRNGRPFCWCLMGAIYEVAPRPDDTGRARSVLFAAIGKSPPAWNDAPERTQAEVVAKLREAASLAERDGV